MSEFDPEYAAAQLGPQGPGFVHYRDLIVPKVMDGVTQELARRDLPWYANFGDTTGQDHKKIEQSFKVFAHKLSHGDQEFIQELPHFYSLQEMVTKQVVEPLQEFFPSLEDWEADEVTAQNYPSSAGKLGWHFDNARHPGLIATASTEGDARLGIRHNGKLHILHLRAGHLVLLRAPGLFKVEPGVNIRPQHSLMEVVGNKPRTSVTIRANDKPDEQIREFKYYNWPRQQAA